MQSSRTAPNHSPSHRSATNGRMVTATRPADCTWAETDAGTSRTTTSICARRMALPTASLGSRKLNRSPRDSGARSVPRSPSRGRKAWINSTPMSAYAPRPCPEAPLKAKCKSLVNRGASGVGQPAVDQVVIVPGQLAAEVADLEIPRADRPDRGDLGSGAGQERLLETLQLVRPNGALGHSDAAAPGEVHHRPTGDAVQEAIGSRRVQAAVA